MRHLYPTTIEDAVKVLDKEKPGWRGLINVAKLNMANTKSCILGQVFGDYYEALVDLFGFEKEHWLNYSLDKIYGRGAPYDEWCSYITGCKQPQENKKGMKTSVSITPLTAEKQTFTAEQILGGPGVWEPLNVTSGALVVVLPNRLGLYVTPDQKCEPFKAYVWEGFEFVKSNKKIKLEFEN